jgi:hypothetical protein
VSVLLFFHLLSAMVVTGLLMAAAVAAVAARRRDDVRGDLLRCFARRAGVGALAATIVAIGLGEGLASDEDASGSWLDASRGLAVFGLLLGGAALVVLAGVSGSRPRLRGPFAVVGVALVVIALATAFVMAAKPS